MSNNGALRGWNRRSEAATFIDDGNPRTLHLVYSPNTSGLVKPLRVFWCHFDTGQEAVVGRFEKALERGLPAHAGGDQKAGHSLPLFASLDLRLLF